MTQIDAPPPRPENAAHLSRLAPVFARQLRALDAHASAFARISAAEAQHVPPAPRWAQDWFARLDAAMAYAMVARLRPGRIIEVGCGHSTRFMAQAMIDTNLPALFIAIDPRPRAPIAGLPVTRLAQPLQQCDLTLFRDLRAGDIAFFDSSHVLAPGSDVELILDGILPLLASGVIVHFHDMFLPDDYPAEWRRRGYNEQQAVEALMLGGAYDTLFASHFTVLRLAPEFAASAAAGLPFLPGAHESSLWLRKRTKYGR